ncbi:uncharacterized protein [Zea mays]|uniref:Uncharacterized protein n=1 Tax=Zea mays TaxID=4577 RepID=A0A1D6M6U5_MAIZE|nr:uncharacterized protein LOC103630511 [Zea mays]AQK86787.1 hypothetical protein ZEAMMB73_Zm00001d038509 [Zea mays]|eukprot:XP_008649798.2 uncharacterized protein LOC103630511 [Zea mays]
MAYRRKQGIQRSATFVEDHRQASSGGSASPAIASPRATRFADDSRRPERPSPLASPAAPGDLTLPSIGERLPAAPAAAGAQAQCDVEPSSPLQDPVTHLYTSPTCLNDEGPKYDLELSKKEHTKHGFWGLLAQKAKVMLDENGTPRIQTSESRWSYDRVRSSESQSPTARRGTLEGRLDIGGKIKDVLEKEGLAVADNTMSGNSHGGVVAAARKLHIRRKACSMDFRAANLTPASPSMSPMLADMESPQLKASRDVANAMAAKVKLLQRELKTLKADLAFSKERCAQLEEENRLLRDGNHDADEDLIRRQLETLLAEKTRLAHENTVYARENRFLREIVDYYQLNMQDVVNLDDDDDDIEEEDDDYDVNADDVELEAEQYQDRRKCLPSRLVLEEEEHQAADPGAEPQSPTEQTESPRMLNTNSGGGVTPDHESPRILNTNSGGGGTPDRESPRILNTNSGVTSDHESPRMLNTNSGGTPDHEPPRMLNTNSGVEIASESPRMLSTNTGGNTNESPRGYKDDGSSPETTRDG